MFLIEKEFSSEITEKKSKFIANIFYVENRNEAEEKIKEIKKKYHDARHNCSAYRVLDNDSIIEKSSDDGEPSGTAGAPMLDILKNQELVNIVVIVTRYFGGILLGTGGLVRAYSEVTSNVVEKAKKIEIVLGKEFKIKAEYCEIENIKYYCRKNNINITNIEYMEKAECNLDIENESISSFLEDIEKRNIKVLEYREIGKKYIKKYNKK